MSRMTRDEAAKGLSTVKTEIVLYGPSDSEEKNEAACMMGIQALEAWNLLEKELPKMSHHRLFDTRTNTPQDLVKISDVMKFIADNVPSNKKEYQVGDAVICKEIGAEAYRALVVGMDADCDENGDRYIDVVDTNGIHHALLSEYLEPTMLSFSKVREVLQESLEFITSGDSTNNSTNILHEQHIPESGS